MKAHIDSMFFNNESIPIIDCEMGEFTYLTLTPEAVGLKKNSLLWVRMGKFYGQRSILFTVVARQQITSEKIKQNSFSVKI